MECVGVWSEGVGGGAVWSVECGVCGGWSEGVGGGGCAECGVWSVWVCGVRVWGGAVWSVECGVCGCVE